VALKEKPVIARLPPEIAMKIAAGEVVTSPAAVVKELLENAVDAGATSLDIAMENGGLSSLLVKDNGWGMDPESMELALQPHCTSKLRSWEDVLHLGTFGFRGEALAAIAAVSEMVFSSRPEGQEVGHRLMVRGGSVLGRESCSMNPGTSVEVRNLFYNVPARRKFLKAPSTEGRHVLQLVEEFLLSHPSIAFRMEKDRSKLLDFPAKSFEQRITGVFQDIAPDSFFTVSVQNGGFGVQGMASRPGVSRPNRSGMHFFVNGRTVRSPLLFSACDSVYGSMMEKRRFPVLVLFLELPQEFVDVNVHPQKLEVKFQQNERVYHLVRTALQKGLGENPPVMRVEPTMPLAGGEPAKRDWQTPRVAETERWRPRGRDEMEFARRLPAVQPPVEPAAQQAAPVALPEFLGVVDRRYVLAQTPEGLLLVDFHAAHERILFEQLKARQKPLAAQALLHPLRLELGNSAREAALDGKKRLSELGFSFRTEGSQIVVEAAPSRVPAAQVEGVFREIVDSFRLLELEEPEKLFDRALATIACHQAVKTGDWISPEQARALLEQMQSLGIYACPHGRPVFTLLKFAELDRFFKRT